MDFSPRQLIFIAVLFAVPVAAFFAVFRPQNREINKARAEIEVKRAMLTSLREVTSQTADLQQATKDITETIAKVESRLPTNKEIDNVLRDVARIAAQCGLKVPRFVKSEQTRQAGTAQEQPIDLEITGDFDGFYRFLIELEKLPRITRLTDMNISRVEDRDRDGLMKGSFKLSIYYQGSTLTSAETSR
jgi:type IV pilus assembly protein PilO